MVTLLVLALQMAVLPSAATAQASASPAIAIRAADEDSLRDVGRAHDAQAGFERGRRYVLPWGSGSGGHCDVRVGRFCWWYEEGQPQGPPEPEEIGRRRTELLGELDDLGRRRPGDPWIAGMRVYYRVDNRQPALADSAARECRAAGWWCIALRAYAAQARNDVVAADSGFSVALAEMPDSTRCAWRDIRALLPGDTRDRYEHLDCAARAAIETRYWMLATPRLAAAANEWRTEFYGRRVAATLLANAVTPHRIGWGSDTEELLLRYGWPNAWSRIPLTGMQLSALEPDILGHDPSPSYNYGPREALLDSAATSLDDGWALNDIHAESRYAHPSIKRIASASAQLARFRRGDSTLVAAAWSTSDDSLRAPEVFVGTLGPEGHAHATRVDSVRTGRAQVMVPGVAQLAGIELLDSASGSLARTRALFAPRRDSTTILLSDLLLYRPANDRPPTLDEALARAIPGDTASLAGPIGLYWESYGADSAGAAVETTILVERLDQGFFTGMRQRLGLADKDSPVQIRWSESRPSSEGVTPRALSLDLSTVPPGRYRITLALTPATGAGAVASREVALKGP